MWHEIICKLNIAREIFLHKRPVSGSYRKNISEELKYETKSNTWKTLAKNLMDLGGNEPSHLLSSHVLSKILYKTKTQTDMYNSCFIMEACLQTTSLCITYLILVLLSFGVI